jgi:hypothetical protein
VVSDARFREECLRIIEREGRPLHDRAFDELWGDGADRGTARFELAQIAGLPAPARRYLAHAIAPGTLVASAVRLRMHGEIRQKRSWYPFQAEQVIRWGRGFVWRARAKMNGLPVVGSDRWIDGEGAMRWKLFGLLPVVTADGPDISRAALGRVQIESVWLPTVLLAADVKWSAPDSAHVGVDLHLADHPGHLDLAVDGNGRLETACIARWGNPERAGADRSEFREYPFGAIVANDKTFDGITIPSEMRVGWYFGLERFEVEGEFFRVKIDHAEFR